MTPRPSRPPRPSNRQRLLWAALLAAVVLAAVAAYLVLRKPGAPRGSGGQAPVSATPAPLSASQVERGIEAARTRTERDPQDANAWAMLAHSHEMLGRFDEAAKAYERLLALRPQDAQVHADYADALGVASKGSLQGEPARLIARALELEPGHFKALVLAGKEAFERKRWADAVALWERALAQTPDAAMRRPIETNIAEAKALQSPGTSSAGGIKAAASPGFVTGRVTVAAALRERIAADDTVFVFARPAGGSRMPVALLRKRSAVAPLNLPAVNNGAGSVVQCYPFVVGAVWGPMARADLTIAGKHAAGLPIQVIDDGAPAAFTPTADCRAAANGELLDTLGRLQARGVLGVGMLRYDCGAMCASGDYAGSYTLYYTCTSANDCRPTAVPAEQQVQNPVAQFDGDNNGTLLALPALPDTGADLARGRLVFGIGTQVNNQLPPGARVLHVQTDPARDDYLYLKTTMAGRSWPYSYIDSGSNGYFFDDASLSLACIAAGKGSSWYCPATPQARTATLADPLGNSADIGFKIVNTDLLFAGTGTAFATLGGATGTAHPGAFVWGLPFFYGRSVFTSIWGQALATGGPWYAFTP